MRRGTRFYINNVRNIGGPGIFGLRLKHELLKKGWRWDSVLPHISYMFSSGSSRPFCKNILRVDGLYFDSENTVGDCDKLNRPIFRAYRRASGIVFQSQFNRRLFAQFAGEPGCPTTVIPNGAPDSFSPEGERIEYGYKKTLICSAKWKAHKRVECAIKGFLTYGDPGTGLVILGSHPPMQLEHPNIRYLGRMPAEQLPKYLRGADAFIHLAWLDHCPNSVVEALCCGLPVLCTHNGGTKEVVRSNGIVLHCEEDYEYQRVPLYDPPRCDKNIVAQGIEQILRWNKPVDASYLRLDRIAGQYMEFAKQLL